MKRAKQAARLLRQESKDYGVFWLFVLVYAGLCAWEITKGDYEDAGFYGIFAVMALCILACAHVINNQRKLLKRQMEIIDKQHGMLLAEAWHQTYEKLERRSNAKWS